MVLVEAPRGTSVQATGNDGAVLGIREGGGAMTEVAATLNELRCAGLYRQLRVIESAQARWCGSTDAR